ncbi:MAG: hypothetical protein ACLUO4_06235, partial [Christensenellales bacterium]
SSRNGLSAQHLPKKSSLKTHPEMSTLLSTFHSLAQIISWMRNANPSPTLSNIAFPPSPDKKRPPLPRTFFHLSQNNCLMRNESPSPPPLPPFLLSKPFFSGDEKVRRYNK